MLYLCSIKSFENVAHALGLDSGRMSPYASETWYIFSLRNGIHFPSYSFVLLYHFFENCLSVNYVCVFDSNTGLFRLFLELEAYSNMISVFRAQGALEDNRKKLLEELRAVLHISNDRHSAEARRVSNDELLATIAEQ